MRDTQLDLFRPTLEAGTEPHSLRPAALRATRIVAELRVAHELAELRRAREDARAAELAHELRAELARELPAGAELGTEYVNADTYELVGGSQTHTKKGAPRRELPSPAEAGRVHVEVAARQSLSADSGSNSGPLHGKSSGSGAEPRIPAAMARARAGLAAASAAARRRAVALRVRKAPAHG